MPNTCFSLKKYEPSRLDLHQLTTPRPRHAGGFFIATANALGCPPARRQATGRRTGAGQEMAHRTLVPHRLFDLQQLARNILCYHLCYFHCQKLAPFKNGSKVSFTLYLQR